MLLVQLRYNFRVYPTPGQQIELARAFGCARVVFNDGLRLRQAAWEAGEQYVSDAELSRRLITEAKLTPERAWLGEVSAVVLQQAVADLNTAYRNFFASITGKRKGRKVAPPRFRSRKDNRQAIRFTKNSRFKVLDNGRLRLPKIGDLAVRWSRTLPSDPSSVTVIKDATGRYFASFVVQVTGEASPPGESEVGIDLGLTHFAVMSDGSKVAAPKFLRRAARKLKRLQRALSRKQKGSANHRKAVVKVARAHARVADTRRDWQHKLSTAIIRENQAVYVEDLCVVGLGRTRLAKSVHDAGWASFTAMLEYKAARYGRTFGRVDRFFPSTRRCSACGRINEKIALHVRAWDCPCGSHHDRDVNAAKNVLAAGQADNANDRGAHGRPGLVPAARTEAVTHPHAAYSTRSLEGISVLQGREDVNRPTATSSSGRACATRTPSST
ncbi:RNA-guided endonuclease InsQ/TnpB family protein [Dactylosporangium sp. CS-047395]|uniref:RNA-guided endonuclease InsQ/TnpB family protein n=1 Tax=Dactylosporangium sp. CS-047395 TaxID=3239936 RepID=UPI003D8DA8F0